MKIFTYHLLYSGTDLIADIGGYLGLFLGLSAFGLVELFEKVYKANKPKEVVDLAKVTSSIIQESMKL
jgi:hypothetical protein